MCVCVSLCSPAFRYYTLRLYGMCHDDYNYSKIPIFLQPSVKQYIKKVACEPYPESISAADFEIKGYSFKDDEKVRVSFNH